MLSLRIPLLAHAVAAAAVPPPPPSSSPLPPLHYSSFEMTCPVGGKSFTAPSVTMYSVYGSRPDGRPYSEVPFPHAIPECPDNGLVVFARFTPAEVAQLARWINTPVYQAMRRTESSFYRAYWLALKIHRPEADAIAQLLPAIWEAKGLDRMDPKRPATTRYQRVLVNAAKKLSPAVSPDDRVWIKLRAANALREMGKFDAAERMRASGEAELPAMPEPAVRDYVAKLKFVIARHDRSDEPLDMIPDVVAKNICRSEPRTDAFDQAYCARRSAPAIETPPRIAAAGDGDEIDPVPVQSVIGHVYAGVKTAPSRVHFINVRNRPVRIFWIAFDGSERSYAELAQGEELLQPTFVGHRWLVRDLADGTPIQAFISTRSDSPDNGTPQIALIR